LSEILKLLDELVSPSSGFFSCLLSLRERERLENGKVNYNINMLSLPHSTQIENLKIQ